MARSPEADREFWRGVLVAGGSSELPRRAGDPTRDVLETEVRLDADLLSRLRALTGELAVSLSSVLLAVHARVLARLSGQADVVVGYVARGAPSALPCRLGTGCGTWQELLAESFCVETAVLIHRAFPLERLRATLGVTGPAFETVFDPTGGDGEASEASGGRAALWVAVTERADGLALRFRCRGEVWDSRALGRAAGHHLRTLESISRDLRLNQADGGRLDGAPEGRGRWGSAEERVSAAWSVVLGVPLPRISRHDDFFECGGTSLSAVKLAIILDRTVSHRDVVEHPTLGELTDLFAQRAPRHPIEPVTSPRQVAAPGSRGVAPC